MTIDYKALAAEVREMRLGHKVFGGTLEILETLLEGMAEEKPAAWMALAYGLPSQATTDEPTAIRWRKAGGDVVPLYTHPAPAAPQAEPMADSDADYWLRNRQPILDAIERAGFMLMSNASGFWLHPRGTTDAQAAEIERLRAGLRAVSDLIDESHGVAGLHRNGDVAPWSDLRAGGKYEAWLVSFDDALKEQR